MKNQGISLISLIITIIVIIILAAIVIFTGLGTPDSANFAKFCSGVDDVQMAVLDVYSDLRVEHAISGDTRNDEQLYKEVATGLNNSQTDSMTVTSGEVHCENITKSKNGKRVVGDLTLPLVQEVDTGWYITETGRVFNLTSYLYDEKYYVNSSTYYDAQPTDAATVAEDVK